MKQTKTKQWEDSREGNGISWSLLVYLDEMTKLMHAARNSAVESGLPLGWLRWRGAHHRSRRPQRLSSSVDLGVAVRRCGPRGPVFSISMRLAGSWAGAGARRRRGASAGGWAGAATAPARRGVGLATGGCRRGRVGRLGWEGEVRRRNRVRNVGFYLLLGQWT